MLGEKEIRQLAERAIKRGPEFYRDKVLAYYQDEDNDDFVDIMFVFTQFVVDEWVRCFYDLDTIVRDHILDYVVDGEPDLEWGYDRQFGYYVIGL